MKILEFKTKAKESAKKLLGEAKKNEPAITKALQAIALLKKVEMAGLENKFKDESSLADKLNNSALKWNNSIAKEARRNNDTLRYTMIFSPDEYRSGYNQVLTELESRGCDVQKIWNAWMAEGTLNDTGYRGINVTIIYSQKQKFELQFHTAESFRLKTETHGLYEERRNPKTSRLRDAEILDILKKLAAKIERPKGM